VPTAAPRRHRVISAEAFDLPAPFRAAPDDAPPRHVRAALDLRLRALLHHDPGTRTGADIEDLHQMRVSVRRMRAALKAARPLLDAAWADGLRAELGWLGRALGPVRDLDVLLLRLRAEVAALPADEQEPGGVLVAALEREREGARADMLAALDAPRYPALLERLADAVRLPPPAPPATRARPGLVDLVRAEARKLRRAVEEAYAQGYLGQDILGSGFDLDIVVHAGAGAYICGEETALLDSLEGRRGQPRLKPPFPATSGLYASPTVVNNVETIASVPAIVLGGAEWFRSMGSEKSPGPKIYSVSGHVERPGQYEAPLGITLRALLELAGGMKDGIPLKFWTPGGSSTPLFTTEHLDVPLDFEGAAAAGSMLGTTAVQVFNETVSVPWAVMKWTEFYKHESCGKCTPCREGTYWLVQILQRMVAGEGTAADVETMLDICDNILGRSFCALGDGATSPITSAIKYFRQEFLDLCAAQPVAHEVPPQPAGAMA